MTQKVSNADKKICLAVLRLAAKRKWQDLTMPALAKAAAMSLPVFQKRFADRDALLPLLVGFVTHEAGQASKKREAGMNVRDRLFELIMARIDVLQARRAAFLSIMAGLRTELRAGLALVPLQITTIRAIYADAHSGKQGGMGEIEIAALWGIYLRTLHVWGQDETLDMSRTMAVLDGWLARAEQAATLLRKACR